MAKKSKTKISFSFISIIWLIFIIISENKLFLPLVSAVLVHELGHIFFAVISKIKIESIKFSLIGAEIKINTEKISYFDEFFLAFFGPLFGLISFFIFLPLYNNEFCFDFAIFSLTLSIFNLLPIKTFDGGRMLLSFLSIISSQNFAEKTLKISTFISIFLLYFCSCYFLLKYNFGISVFIFSLLIFIRFFVAEDRV